MEVRRDIFPPLLALLVSLILHGALAAFDLGIFVPAEKPPEELVSIALIEPEIEAPPSSVSPSANKAESLSENPPKAPLPQSAPKSEEPLPKTPETKTANPAKAASPPPEPLKEVEEAPRKPAPDVEAPPEVAEEETPLDLSVSPEDLSRLTPENPDPAKSPGEVTIDIRDKDLRYRGFLEAVRSAIDRSWNWREALLAAERPGSVTVRISLTPSGHADATIAESSGSSILDNEALATVRRAQMPYFPNHWTISRLNLFAQFDYTFYGEE